jgi:hypothetical protein
MPFNNQKFHHFTKTGSGQTYRESTQHESGVFLTQHGCSEYTGLVQFKDGRIGAGFDDGGPFPPHYQVRESAFSFRVSG